VFRIAKDGSGYTTLHAFQGSDGQFPRSRLRVVNGVFYGTTDVGGAHGGGVVYRLRPDGTGFAVLRHFKGSDGQIPVAPLTHAGDLLYGTTFFGGANGAGTIFKLKTNGTAFQKIHDFGGGSGTNPRSAVTLSKGVLYGSTDMGGANGAGVVFRVNPDGTGFKVLSAFNAAKGYPPTPSLRVEGGLLFSMTPMGGAWGGGTIVKSSTSGGTLKVLHEFDGADGAQPHAGLARGVDSALYGTTYAGGAHGMGVIFRLVTDSDEDGLADDADNCVFALNPGQGDRNGNGLGDACDTQMPTTSGIAALKSPVPGSVLAAAPTTFQWTAGVGVVQYKLTVGSKQGAADLYSKVVGASLSVKVTGLPTDGRKLFVRIHSWKQGRWLWNDYVYRATGP
jgi:uncharacterized repeat protein (TIGR03803 family)